MGLALAALMLMILGSVGPGASPAARSPAQLAARNPLPLTFEPNAGQADPAVRFLAHSAGSALFFTPGEVVLALEDRGCRPPGGPAAAGPGPRTAAPAPPRTLRLQFVDPAPATLVGGHDAAGRVNYLRGADPRDWATDLPTYTGITYSGLYPGVDLQFTGAGGQLKGTYALAAGADPARIRWRYAGARGVRVDAAGDLHITWAGEPLIEQAPLAWQVIDGQRVAVAARYSVAEDGGIGFLLGAYDRTQPLTVDPTLTYSTYLGGSDADEATGIAVDSAGNVYLTGYTYSTNFPLSSAYQGNLAGAYDVFVTKLSADGSSLIYSTYLGGSGTESGAAITVDGAGNATITGYTYSTNFPIQNAFQPTNAGAPDGFLTRLNPAGSGLVFSTYLGGSAGDYGTGVAVSSTGDVYLSGYTQSTNFPLANPMRPANAGATDAFITRFNAAGSGLVYSTYLGGAGDDQAQSVAVDSVGNAYISGYTQSANFPLNNAYQPAYGGGTYDAFVSVLNTPGAALIYSTYLGGSGLDRAAAIRVDGSSNAIITGYTQSLNFPTQSAFQPANAGATDAFLTKFNAIGSALIYSTYLGGNGDDEAQGLGLGSGGTAYLTGFTSSTNFPTQSAYQPANGGSYDAFMTTFNAAGSALTYSTYLGGGSADRGAAIAVDAAGGATITGSSQSVDFPLVNPYQPGNNGLLDAFVAKLSDTPAATPTPTASPIIAEWEVGAPLLTPVVRAVGVVYLLPGTLDAPEHYHNRTRFEMFGGSAGPSGAAQMRPFEYQPLTDTWTLKQAVFDDSQVTDMVAGVLTDGVGSRIYLVGGRAPGAVTATNKVRIYDPIADVTPTVLTSDPWPVLNTLPGGAAVVNNRLYVFGGYEGNVGTKFQIWEFDPLRAAGTRWQLKSATLPAAKGFIPTFALGSAIYLAGGATYDAASGTLQDSATAYRYDPVADTLTAIAALPRATSHTGAVEVDGELWVLGGGISPPAPYNLVQVYNPGTNTWRAGPPFMLARRNAAIGVALDHEVFVAGGETMSGATQSLENYREGVPGSPTPAPTPCALTFADVPPGNTFYAAIRCLACQGIVGGYPCGGPGEPCPGSYFRPNNNVTRAQLAKIVAIAAAFSDPVPSTQQTFEDVPSNNGLWLYVERAVGHGLINGYPCGGNAFEPCNAPLNRPYFRPFNNATRGQISKIVGTAAGFTEAVASTQQTFEDVPTGSTFWEYIERMATRGVIGGYPCGGPGEPCNAPGNRPYFRPNNNATRGQISKITAQAFFPGCNPPSR
jgi:hypothetical protein